LRETTCGVNYGCNAGGQGQNFAEEAELLAVLSYNARFFKISIY